MPGFEPHAGSPDVERDARGDHDLLFGADEEGEILRTLAPGIFSARGGAGPITSTYGQFVSIMYEALIIVPTNNGPSADKKFGTHRARASALRRWWVNTLAVMNRLGAACSDGIKQSKQRGELIERLGAMRALATPTELASLCLFDADLEPVNCLSNGSLPTMYSTMPIWFQEARWQRGSLADEENGSLQAAGRMELYSIGRLNFHNGMTVNSHARAFAVAAEAAAERSALALGHTAATWGNVPAIVKANKVVQYIAGCRWPAKLDHWQSLPIDLLTDMNDLFIYTDCGGVGKPAEKELLSTPSRTRFALAQIPLVNGVVANVDSTSNLHAALRRLIQASTDLALPELFVTLDAVLYINDMLKHAEAHCSGIEFAAKTFDDRLAIAVRLLTVRRGVMSPASSSGHHALAQYQQCAGTSDAKSGASAGYDKLRLLDCKNTSEYVISKRQLLAAKAARNNDKAILACARGADGLPAAAGLPVSRLSPLKVLHDVLFGVKDVYQVDKELESAITELRRNLPKFWGRRVAKALKVQLRADVPLDGLAKAMADTASWSVKPPDFYALALVPVLVAAGAEEDELYKSHQHSKGQSPYTNMAVVNATSMLVVSLLADIGVAHTEVHDVLAPGADLASPADLFKLASEFHVRLGSLSTTAAKMNELILGVLGDFGTQRADIRKSSDAMRPINTRLIEHGSERLSEFVKEMESLKNGQFGAADLRAAGFVVQKFAPSAPPSNTETPRKRALEQREPQSSLEDEQPEEGPSAEDWSWYDTPEVTAELIEGGDVLHIKGGYRGPNGCYYQISGPDGVAAALAEYEGMSEVCPVWFSGIKCNIWSPALHMACGNESHEPGSAAHPNWSHGAVQRWTPDIKMSDFRVWRDVSDGSYSWSAPVAGYKGKGKGGGKGKQSKGKGKGKGH